MKVVGWWERLNEYLLESRGRPRVYGEWDCWQFVGGAVLVMTGIDYREQFPSYSSLEEGRQILLARGGEEAMLTEMFGEKKHVAFAQRGDIVLTDLGEGLAGGICIGVDVMTVSPSGIETVRTLSGVSAWTV